MTMAPKQQSLAAVDPLSAANDELQELLGEATKVNRNYDPDPRRIAKTLQADISRALFTETGSRRHEEIAAARLKILILRIRSRINQIEKTNGEENPLWRGKNKGDDEVSIIRSPRSLLKTAHEAFSHPADRIAGRRPFEIGNFKTRAQIIEEQNIVLPPHIAIDPNRISATFLKHFGPGNGENGAEKASMGKIERLTRTRIAAIPFIKDLLGRLEPIPLTPQSTARKNYRLYRVRDGEHKGYIVGFQENGGSERAFLATLPTAALRTAHITQEQYPEENETLNKIASLTDKLYKEVTENWEEAKTPEIMRASIEELEKCVKKLRLVRDQDKSSLKSALQNAIVQLSRKNRGAVRASINNITTHPLIAGRKEKILDISTNLTKDGGTLNQHLQHENEALAELYEKIHGQEVAPRLANPDAVLDEHERERLRAKLRRLSDEELAAVCFMPNLAFAEKMSECLTKTADLLEDKNLCRKGAAEFFVRAYLISKLARFYSFMLSVYKTFTLSAVHSVNINGLKDEFIACEKDFFERGVAKDIPAPEFSSLWADAGRLMDDLREKFVQYETADSDEKKRTQVIEEIKDLLNSFDAPAQVRARRFPDTLRV